MIKPEDRFYSEGQGYFSPRERPITETHYNVWDWDQLRLIKVKGTAKFFPPDEDVENSILAQFADNLSPEVVDFLNLELGIIHQDITPRNLLVDPETDNILLFDFDWAANGKDYLLDDRDDVSSVVFTLYEIITNDTHFTSIPHWERNMDMVQTSLAGQRRGKLFGERVRVQDALH
ncbi:hypothetical protein N7517_010221 [Penicillium concentricum]|uniref:non-specific serine/threonine protein kinase n=1 Tax=Penicillium concentricum TaxID=293559 RepID=A0A9W9R8I6_9EURO|nr:uncharacterized protein N7517_010221 [Penicillium concentricum]KAJ5355612.1 hypothetical protein N7517_010221 [Penicillium concentricum]